jgi:hypothetical protein
MMDWGPRGPSIIESPSDRLIDRLTDRVIDRLIDH